MMPSNTSLPARPRSESRAAPGGKEFWRGLEELAESPAFQEMLHREFPVDATTWSNPVTRRQFLTLMGASLAMAGLTGCSPQPPVRKIMPYARQPEQIVPGKPRLYATCMTLGGLATGLLVKSHEGRPTKIEGNPKHPASLGATDPFAQAAILDLYDPDRSQSVTYRGEPRGWSDAQLALRTALEKMRGTGGRGLRILTDTVSSPTLQDQIAGDREGSLLRQFPEARWIQNEPTFSDGSAAGARLAFGEEVTPVFDVSSADVIVSLDADFLACQGASVRYSREFAKRRRAANADSDRGMNRLYVVESTPSITGVIADHRLPLKARDVEPFARALAAEIGATSQRGEFELSDIERRWIRAIAKDLADHRGAALLIAGETQPAAVHALAHAMNESLGATDRTVSYIRPTTFARPIKWPICAI